MPIYRVPSAELEVRAGSKDKEAYRGGRGNKRGRVAGELHKGIVCRYSEIKRGRLLTQLTQ